MGEQVRIGVIGCGNIGKTHAKAFAGIAGRTWRRVATAMRRAGGGIGRVARCAARLYRRGRVAAERHGRCGDRLHAPPDARRHRRRGGGGGGSRHLREAAGGEHRRGQPDGRGGRGGRHQVRRHLPAAFLARRAAHPHGDRRRQVGGGSPTASAGSTSGDRSPTSRPMPGAASGRPRAAAH